MITMQESLTGRSGGHSSCATRCDDLLSEANSLTTISHVSPKSASLDMASLARRRSFRLP